MAENPDPLEQLNPVRRSVPLIFEQSELSDYCARVDYNPRAKRLPTPISSSTDVIINYTNACSVAQGASFQQHEIVSTRRYRKMQGDAFVGWQETKIA
jgi:hypothetical protein